MLRIPWVVTGMFLLSLMHSACTVESDEEKQAKLQKAIEAERDTKLAEVAAEFVKSFNGDEKWQEALEKQPLTTVALQQKLIRPRGQAIIATVSVLDVAKEGDHYRLDLFAPSILGGLVYRQRLFFELRCTLADVKFDELRPDPIMGDMRGIYLVAARVHEVKSDRRMLFAEETNSGLEKIFTAFTATGDCLGLKDIGAIREPYDQKLLNSKYPERKGVSGMD